jgi:hypothetical protein
MGIRASKVHSSEHACWVVPDIFCAKTDDDVPLRRGIKGAKGSKDRRTGRRGLRNVMRRFVDNFSLIVGPVRNMEDDLWRLLKNNSRQRTRAVRRRSRASASPGRLAMILGVGESHSRWKADASSLFRRHWPKGLAGAPRSKPAKIKVSPNGLGLHWPLLGAHLYVPALIEGAFGSHRRMQQIGKLGGSSRCAAKAKASREKRQAWLWSEGNRGGIVPNIALRACRRAYRRLAPTSSVTASMTSCRLKLRSGFCSLAI